MEISAKLIKELRAKTGISWMQCKKALQESDGDFDKAVELLRKWGESFGSGDSNVRLAEGLVASYVHTGGQIGVLVEVNCNTDFVARTQEFQRLARDIAMQIVACPDVKYVKLSDIPAEVSEREKEIEMGRDDLADKPETIKQKIVQGRIEKRLKQLCLMEQFYIRNQSITVEELVKQTIAQLGESIQVRRFTRYVLGEGIDQQGGNLDEEPPTGGVVLGPKKPLIDSGAAQMPGS